MYQQQQYTTSQQPPPQYGVGGGYSGQQQQQAAPLMQEMQPVMPPPPPYQEPNAGPVSGSPWGDLPAASDAPVRQDSWGAAPPAAEWGGAFDTGDLYDTEGAGGGGQQQQQQNQTLVDHNTRSKDAWSGKERGYLIASIFFMLVVWFHIGLYIYCSQYSSLAIWDQPSICSSYGGSVAGYVIGGFVFIIMLVVNWASPVRAYLDFVLGEPGSVAAAAPVTNDPYQQQQQPIAMMGPQGNFGGIVEYLRHLQVTAPIIRWSIACYHNVSSGSGKNRRTRRVYTHRANSTFPYDFWWDVSQPAANTGGAKATRLRCKLTWMPGDQFTSNLHNTTFRSWVQFNDRDRHKTVSCTADVAGFREEVLAFRDQNSRPALFGKQWYFLMMILTFGAFYQMYFYSMTIATDFKLEKIIKRVPRPNESHVVVMNNATGIRTGPNQGTQALAFAAQPAGVTTAAPPASGGGGALPVYNGKNAQIVDL